MKMFIKHVVIVIVTILSVLLVILAIKVFTLDWRYAHKSHMLYQEPFNWALYKSEVAVSKFIRSLLNNKKEGLPIVRIYISEKSQRKLLEDTPQSTKKWVGGFFLLDNGKLKQIEVRHRGDNPRNWLFEKKTWRIKTRKSEIFNRTRYIEYWPYSLEKYSSGSIANRMGVMSPKFRLIELFINDKSSGIFIETEKLNEGFLRRNKIMPVNLYKGEQRFTETLIGVETSLFNNPGVWTKLAYFNQISESDKSDLSMFLTLLRNAESEKIAFNELLQRANIEIWAKFAAYQILTQNYHNDNSHNMRLILDPWSGIVYPIVNDPIVGVGIHQNSILPLETSSHELLLLLNRSSVFIDTKYKKVLDYVKNSRVLSNEANSLRNLEKAIHTSSKRDIALSRLLYKNINWVESFKKRKLVTPVGKSLRQKFVQHLERHQDNIIKKLYSQPKSSWYENLDGFSIFVSGEMPISNLVISYKNNLPKWIAIDLNGNSIIDDNEIKINPNEDGNIIIPAKLYSNRIKVSQNTYELSTTSSVITINTKFNIISENSSKPHSISGTNPFSGQRFILEVLYSKAVLPSKFNQPIYIDDRLDFNNQVKEFSGNINVTADIIINDKSKIYPGTKFLLSDDASIIFKNKVVANGTPDQPIIFEKRNLNEKSWGTIALQGNKTRGSIFNNIIMQGGSGDEVNQIRYTSMFSLHKTSDIVINNLRMKNNSKYDDMLHIVYCNKITINDVILKNAYSDAIDIDMSKEIIIKNATILNPGNDSIDLMETEALIETSYLFDSGDKGISVGENSNVVVHNSIFRENNIGLASKDGSRAYILYSDLKDNKMHLSAYAKNWQYGGGGTAYIYKSYIMGKLNQFNSTNNSSVTIGDSSIVGEINQQGKNLIFKQDIDYFDSKKTSNEINMSIVHPLFSHILPVKDKNKRGSELSSNELTKWN